MEVTCQAEDSFVVVIIAILIYLIIYEFSLID